MVCSWLAGSVRAESVAASRMERALSEVASSLNGHMSRHGSQQSWLIQAQIWLQLGMHAHTHTHTCTCVHVHTRSPGYLRLMDAHTCTLPPSTIPHPPFPPYTHIHQTQACRDALGHRHTETHLDTDTLTHRHTNTLTHKHAHAPPPHPLTHTCAPPTPTTHTHTHWLTEAAVCFLVPKQGSECRPFTGQALASQFTVGQATKVTVNMRNH